MARTAVQGGKVGGVCQLLLLVVSLMSIAHGSAALKVGFYNTICPKAESTIKGVVQSRFNADKTITPALLRLFFHDCFVTVSSNPLNFHKHWAPGNGFSPSLKVAEFFEFSLVTWCCGVLDRMQHYLVLTLSSN